MTQANAWSVPLIGPASPTTMASRTDDSLDALLSSHSGTTRPSYAVAGTVWLNTATAGQHKYYEYDGTADRLLFTVATATGALTWPGGTMSAALAMSSQKITGLENGTASGDAVNKSQLDVVASKYVLKTGNYTAVASDNNNAIRFTATATLALTAAATLANGWMLYIVADGGAVTIDPNGSETINGLTTLVIPNGTTAQIICDGSNFFVVLKAAFWEAIGDFTASAATSIDVTNLGSFRKLRISGSIQPSAQATLLLRTSTNNGSSFDAGASDYSYQAQVSTGTTVSTAATTSTSIALASSAGTDASTPYVFDVNIEDFNKAIIMRCLGRGIGPQSSAASLFSVGALRNQATARNAIRLLMSTGTITGTVTVEGMRG